MNYVYPAVIYKADEKTAAIFPDLENLAAIGSDLTDAIRKARAACGMYLIICLHDDEQLPAPSAVNAIDIPAVLKEIGMEQAADNAFIKMIAVDLKADAAQYEVQMVKKTFHIPMWLNTLCEVRDIDLCEVLLNALLEKIRSS